MARLSDRKDWFEIWKGDKESVLACMTRNMVSDIEAGFNPCGESIKRQQREIERYNGEMKDQIDRFKKMEEKEVNRWCFYDLIKRGAIA